MMSEEFRDKNVQKRLKALTSVIPFLIPSMLANFNFLRSTRSLGQVLPEGSGAFIDDERL